MQRPSSSQGVLKVGRVLAAPLPKDGVSNTARAQRARLPYRQPCAAGAKAPSARSPLVSTPEDEPAICRGREEYRRGDPPIAASEQSERFVADDARRKKTNGGRAGGLQAY
jgi:hypothetical protein